MQNKDNQVQLLSWKRTPELNYKSDDGNVKIVRISNKNGKVEWELLVKQDASLRPIATCYTTFEDAAKIAELFLPDTVDNDDVWVRHSDGKHTLPGTSVRIVEHKNVKGVMEWEIFSDDGVKFNPWTSGKSLKHLKFIAEAIAGRS